MTVYFFLIGRNIEELPFYNFRPLTVKIRTGIYMDKPFADKLAPNLFEWGADLVTLHGRSREQRYTKLANWDYIGEVAKAVSPKPLFGNGDIINYEDYNEFKYKSGAAGCMLARGIYIFFFHFLSVISRIFKLSISFLCFQVEIF